MTEFVFEKHAINVAEDKAITNPVIIVITAKKIAHATNRLPDPGVGYEWILARWY